MDFESVYKRAKFMEDQLFRHFRKKLPRCVTSEEIRSALRIGAWKAYRHWNPNCSFPNYAHMRMRGEVLDYLRSLDWISRPERARNPDFVMYNIENFKDQANMIPSKFKEIAQDENEGIFDKIIDLLPKERHKIVLRMYLKEGYSMVQIGEYLGVSGARISQYYHTAIKQLKQLVPRTVLYRFQYNPDFS